MDWFLYDNGPCHERVKRNYKYKCLKKEVLTAGSRNHIKLVSNSRQVSDKIFNLNLLC